MSSTSSVAIAGGAWIPRSTSRDPRIVAAYNDYFDALDSNGNQVVGSSIMGVATSEDRGQTWTFAKIPYPTGTSFLDAVGGNPTIASTGWMQPSIGGAAPAQSTLAYVAEAFDEDTSPTATNRAPKLVCSSSNDGGLTWSQPRSIPPFVSLQSIVAPSHPSVTFWGAGKALLAFVGDIGQPTARVVLTDAGLGDLAGDCRFRAPVVSFPEADTEQARSLRRVKVVANQPIGPILAVEYKARIPDAMGSENNARCRVDVEQLVFTPMPAPGGYTSRMIVSIAVPCRELIPASPEALNLSHFDIAVDEQVNIAIPGVDTRSAATNVHVVTVGDFNSDDLINGSEVVYSRISTNGSGATQTHSLSAPFVLSDAVRSNEIVFQPTVSAVALPFQTVSSVGDVFVTWYQMNANGQVRLLGRRLNANTTQWGPEQVLHTSVPNRTESVCSTTDAISPIWSRYGGSVALIDGWPARGALNDPNTRFDAFPLAVTLFTSSRTRACSNQTRNSALYQELHAARWR
jgi:hypothetical protein